MGYTGAGQAFRRAGLALVALLVAAMGAWGALALYWFDDLPGTIRTPAALAFALAALAALGALASTRWRWPASAAFLLLFVLLLWRWEALAPSNERNWQAAGKVAPHATVSGVLVTVHGIRNFDYRSEDDFDVAYYDRTFDVRLIDSVDLLAVYWMGPAIAHVFLSFGFAGGQHLAVSIEARKEDHEPYAALPGFFRQYELQYVAADERDVIRLRTNYRRDPPEDVYLYRLNGSPEDARRLFMEYIEQMNRLYAKPQFYNTLASNCTSNIWLNSRVNPDHLQFSWKLLASGYLPEYLYESGRLDNSVPFEELRRRSRINERAQAADAAADFSLRIRLPVANEN